MNLDERPPLNGPKILAALEKSGTPWRKIDVVAETGSTNADMLARLQAGEDVGDTVLIAEKQTAGRGRIGRSWSSGRGAQITMSAVVSARDVPPDAWGWVPLATGLAVVDAVAAVTGVHVGLKWPNDVLWSERKLAGILAEVAAPTPMIVIGIGLNVTADATEVGAPAAVSLKGIAGLHPDRDHVVTQILLALALRLTQWRTGGDAGLLLGADYRAHCVTIGSEVRVLLPDERVLTGAASDVDGQGRLLVNTGGVITAISAGDVVHVRPVG